MRRRLGAFYVPVGQRTIIAREWPEGPAYSGFKAPDGRSCEPGPDGTHVMKVPCGPVLFSLSERCMPRVDCEHGEIGHRRAGK